MKKLSLKKIEKMSRQILKETGYKDLYKPVVAEGMCSEISFFLKEKLKENSDLSVSVIYCYNLLDEYKNRRNPYDGHNALLVNIRDESYVFDFTFRQFDPKCPYPMVIPYDKYSKMWDSVSE